MEGEELTRDRFLSFFVSFGFGGSLDSDLSSLGRKTAFQHASWGQRNGQARQHVFCPTSISCFFYFLAFYLQVLVSLPDCFLSISGFFLCENCRFCKSSQVYRVFWSSRP
ncbi:hypothetical protein L6452_14513 [Arctium lappa]|uniref:Uncharacterized protein n=1 Tax=Arctium lappa TaxID=4217 RepID=A0ACB9CLP4_ARCLA|nr:hypothetical protein L6452_14513 [Arctium lappa]